MSKMFRPRITVDGLGGIINREMEIIKRALTHYGYTIEVENDWPPSKQLELWNQKPGLTDEQAGQLIIESLEQRILANPEQQKETNHALLVAIHQPWGG